MKKKLSIKEQKVKISSFLHDNELLSFTYMDNLIIKEMQCKNNFFYKEIENIDYCFFKKVFLNNSLIISGDLIQLLIDQGFIQKNVVLYLYCEKGIYFIKSAFIEKPINVNQFVINKGCNESFYIDLNLFYSFHINSKTANHFSYIILNKIHTSYLSKRKDYYFLVTQKK